jgi:uncharacterized protein (DUF2461 family)
MSSAFGKHKFPYKTISALLFPHENGKTSTHPATTSTWSPVPSSSQAGSGTPGKTLRQIRDAVVAGPKAWGREWKRVISGKAFRARCTLGGDSLTKPPKGYDPDHPLLEDLKRKDLVTYVPFTEEQAVSAGFRKQVLEAFHTMKPFMAF